VLANQQLRTVLLEELETSRTFMAADFVTLPDGGALDG